jgi:hypothetical protein
VVTHSLKRLNPKFEYLNPKQIPNPNLKTKNVHDLIIGAWGFDVVWDFEFGA